MKSYLLQPGDKVYRITISGIEIITIDAVEQTLALSGLRRFKREVVDNIKFTLQVPVPDRVPLAPLFRLFNAKNYERFQLQRFNVPPIFSNAERCKKDAPTQTTNNNPAGTTHKSSKRKKVSRKSYKRAAASAQKLGTVETPRPKVAQVLQHN